MQNQAARLVMLTWVMIFVAASAHGQPLKRWADRGFINVNGGYQARSQEFGASLRFTLYEEEASFETRQGVDNGGLLDVSGGVRIWRNLGIGVGFSRFNRGSGATITGRVPHPLFFDLHRAVATEASGLKHRQQTVHAQMIFMIPLMSRLDVALSAGPSFLRVAQDVVGSIEVREAGAPFTTVTVSQVPTTSVKKTAVGVNVGADVSVMATRHVGGGFLVRYATGSVDLPAGSAQVSLDAGGFQIGGGLRVRF